MSTSNNHPEQQQPHPNQNQDEPHLQTQSQPRSQSQPQPPNPEKNEKEAKLPIHTHHCRFCNHLLLATTLQSLSSLPTRKPPAKDGAVIVPLELSVSSSSSSLPPSSSSEKETTTEAKTKEEKEGKKDLHTTILLSTTQPDRGFTIVRREDGFEKRRLLRCGRCRVVVGYFLDGVHFANLASSSGGGGGVKGKGEGEVEEEDEEEEEEKKDEVKVVYLLPGALMETGVMVKGDEEELRRLDRGWSSWA